MRNNDLLEATLHAIEDHPELHDQSWYFTRTHCGTAMCFAGWACQLAGYRAAYWTGDMTSHVAAPGGREAHDAFDTAQDLLGLTRREAITLFGGGNTLAALQYMVKDLCNGDEIRSHEYYMSLDG